MNAGALAGFQHVERLFVIRGENGERLGQALHLRGEPGAFAFPLVAIRAVIGRAIPRQPFTVMTDALERLLKTVAALGVRPVVGIAVKSKMLEAAGEKMFRNHSGGVGVLFEHALKRPVRAAETEIHRGRAHGPDELGEVVASTEPGENAVSLPAPRDGLLPAEVGGKMPAVLLCVFLDAAVQAVIVPPKGHENTFLGSAHGARVSLACNLFNKFCKCFVTRKPRKRLP
jgi:hypothetical protein